MKLYTVIKNYLMRERKELEAPKRGYETYEAFLILRQESTKDVASKEKIEERQVLLEPFVLH